MAGKDMISLQTGAISRKESRIAPQSFTGIQNT